MEEDPLLALALEALSPPRAAAPSAKPPGVARRPQEAKRVNGNGGSAHAAQRATFRPTPGMIPVAHNDRIIAPARDDYNASEQRTVRPLPPPVVHRNSNTLFRPGAANTNTNSKYGNGAAMELPSSSRGYKDLGQGSLIRKYSGLNVKNPLVSSSQLESRLNAQSVVKLSDIVSRNHSVGLPNAWATLAAVGEISNRQEDSQGRPYAIWKLTDLNDTMITLFLFGQAYHDCHKDGRAGMVVALFGAKVRSEGGKFSLNINSGDNMLELGTASEFGYCKSKTKSGHPCRIPVNTRVCEYCSAHVLKEYNRLQPKRHELQGNSLKSAFKPGMKNNSISWNPGQFQPLNAVSRPKLAAATTEQLKEAAAAAAARAGTSSGARYMKTVADPTKAHRTAQEIELSRLRNNTLAPGAAPIPLARSSKVVYQEPMPARKRGGRGGGGSSALGGNSDKRARIEAGKKDDEEMIELEDGDIFEELQQPAPQQQPAPAPQRVSVGGGGVGVFGGSSGRGTGVGRSAAGVGSDHSISVPAARAPPTSKTAVAPQRPPPPSSIVDNDARQRAIAIRKTNKSATNNNENATPAIAKVPSNTPAFLFNSLKHQEEERQQQRQQQQEEDQEVELDDEEDVDFTIAAKHSTSNGNQIASGSGRSTTAASKNFFGNSSSRQPPSSSTGFIPGLGTFSKSGTTKPPKVSLKDRVLGKGKSGGGGGRSTAGGGGSGPAPTGFAAAFGSVIREMQQAEASNPHQNQPKGSLYQDIVEKEDDEQLFNLMGVLEKKDAMATKMDSIKSINVPAWKCEICSSITEYRPKTCGESHPHALTQLQVNKRFWQCGACKGHFHTLGMKYPKSRCPKCNVLEPDFIQASMLRPQKKLDHEKQQSNIAGRELLAARGTEQKWVNQ